MSEERMIAFLGSQVACAMIEMEAMKAENKYREMRGESIGYVEIDFIKLIDKYGIGHNSAIETLNQ